MTIQEEIIGMNNMFISIMAGSVNKDWMVVGGELEFTNSNDVILNIGVIFAPYNYVHSEAYNRKLYTKIVEAHIKEIENADDDELNNLVDHLNSVVGDNVDLSVINNFSKGYLRGAHDYQYALWANNPESEIGKLPAKIETIINVEYYVSEYFIYEDLALIRAGLDGKISNSMYYGDDLNMSYDTDGDGLKSFTEDEEDDVWSLFEDGQDN